MFLWLCIAQLHSQRWAYAQHRDYVDATSCNSNNYFCLDTSMRAKHKVQPFKSTITTAMICDVSIKEKKRKKNKKRELNKY